MKRFQNILLGVKAVESMDDGAFERVADLARTNGAKVKLMSVIEDIPGIIRMLIPSVKSMESLIERERAEELDVLRQRLLDRGIDAEVKVIHGRPFVEIIREVLREDHDMVVVTAHEPGNDSDWFFGSTAMYLLRKCPCALWVFKPGKTNGFERILAAVDSSSDEPGEKGLNREILDLSHSLSRMEDAQLEVIHAWSFWGESLFRKRMPEEELAGLIEAARKEAARRLSGLLDEAGVSIPEERIFLAKGEPENTIPQCVKNREIDLLVIGTVARTGVPGLIMGNTAERLLEQIECSVLAVKPEGFVSPVTLD